MDIDGFMAETYQLLDEPGVLIVTTDYWHPKIDTADATRDREEVSALVESARRAGFELLKGDQRARVRG